MKTLPISEARANLLKLVDEVDNKFDRITLTKSGKAKAVLMSVDEFDSWMETIDVLNDSATMAALVEAQHDVATGRLVTHDEVVTSL